jgi:hypothetical protein
MMRHKLIEEILVGLTVVALLGACSSDAVMGEGFEDSVPGDPGEDVAPTWDVDATPAVEDSLIQEDTLLPVDVLVEPEVHEVTDVAAIHDAADGVSPDVADDTVPAPDAPAAVDTQVIADVVPDAEEGGVDTGSTPETDTVQTSLDADIAPDTSPDVSAQSGVCDDSYIVKTAQQLEALSHCVVITGAVNIAASPLTGLAPLAGLVEVGDSLRITHNGELTSLDGLGQLQSVGGQLEIYQNASLATFAGLDALETVGGSLVIFENPAMLALDGFPKLTTVSGNLSIGDPAYTNTTLETITGLSALTDVAWQVRIIDLDGLVSVTGLGVLGSIGMKLEVTRNGALVNLDGLATLSSVGSDLSIADNASLPSCAAWALVDQVQAGDGVGGEVDVTGNDTPCEPEPCAAGGCQVKCDSPGEYICL